MESESCIYKGVGTVRNSASQCKRGGIDNRLRISHHTSDDDAHKLSGASLPALMPSATPHPLLQSMASGAGRGGLPRMPLSVSLALPASAARIPH
jgi:hypothetical protein